MSESKTSSEIIPAIDIIGGECVRLTQGDYGRKKTYGLDIPEVAKAYEAAGVRRLHCVDLDGAKAGGPVNLAVLEKLAAGTG
ncbi:MAG: 1-(5-phosphoribosyl)-5-[(5-phosphoribosylamino)methylideneamino]imidazole-4-carboxamide isomerase, partial [Clostridia bacterium]|nr:1-(5-phosphoribosyl)-5-[(5-phosphoribosylamino)methylideneamino]imidazole-4-carboxamide isomerase [Clostridia bacterium]